MFLLFEEAGKFLAGRLLSETDSSAQVELESGKRVKVKFSNILLRFEKPAPAQLISQAQSLSETIELELAWEFAPEDEFGFAEFAGVYFSDPPTLEQQVAALFRLFEAPHYFRRAGKGRFRKAPAEIIAQALAAIEKKRLTQAQIEEWAQALAQGVCPEPIREQLYKILFKPDKNAPEYKAVVEASRTSQTAPLEMLQKVGAIDSPYQFHWQRFLYENFPKGYKFPVSLDAFEIPDTSNELPLSQAQAFSIDDSATTEIDDALSVTGLGTGTVTVGIHIAAPALAVQRGDPIDLLGSNRLSTVYMPGFKITMLPDAVVQRFTLLEGRDCPAVSLYVAMDEQSLEIRATETRLEKIRIQSNLRHDQLDAIVTERWLEQPEFINENAVHPLLDLRTSLSFLYRLGKHLKAQREVVRGKPETFNRPDYNFKLIGNQHKEPVGSEQVEITLRQRGAPLDLIVAEAMILANSTWGQWLADHGVPAIYRSQASLAPGVKVRMGTKALPHAGIGVKSYAWSTSPLRRYTDLVNQWQIIACAQHGKTAALAAPFKPKDADLFSIISNFDATYGAYSSYQGAMERYWTLKYIAQQGITELNATLFKDNLARADSIPLVLPVLGVKDFPRGTRIRIRLGAIDEVSLDISATLIEQLDTASEKETDSVQDEEDDLANAGPISIAIDVSVDNPQP
jgi:exoribonuclease-2